MSNRFRSIAAAAFLAAALAGCSAVGLQSPQVAFYDLGLADAVAVPAALAPVRVDVVAPSWLGSSAMQYRLAWKQPDRRRNYVESRWVAPPADMLAQSLGRALRAGDDGGNGAASRCRLRLELDEFIQVFETEQRNHVRLVVRAQLLPPRGVLPLAAHEFSRDDAAGTPDAEGGVAAARAAVRGLTADLAGWLGALDRRTAQGLNRAGSCLPA
ncbi:ABC-type transport auxiliary lipoprotein family protein [Thauera sinica]|uniref:ABC-type transport auxiliary lipoprotein family protein n=1 Tax=Thauera sinica TaxID=2665146 RepID=A0ABW1AWI8_9RHOO|nr:ABC-type transport auxiliary lipoprotein family protein [Thauera sp. K11]ATE62579.1 hypothetical protein CCZ27_09945 [Thauera sp. K11]